MCKFYAAATHSSPMCAKEKRPATRGPQQISGVNGTKSTPPQISPFVPGFRCALDTVHGLFFVLSNLSLVSSLHHVLCHSLVHLYDYPGFAQSRIRMDANWLVKQALLHGTAGCSTAAASAPARGGLGTLVPIVLVPRVRELFAAAGRIARPVLGQVRW